MTALQQIIKEAQAIRRKSPKMEWKKAVAQASAIYSSKNKGKKNVVKKVAKKKAVGKYVKTVRKGKITDVIYKRKKIAGVKKKAIKKTATKKAPVVSRHKDTKSHNVNIRVMSGMVKPKPTIVALSKKISNATASNEHTKAILLLAKFLKDKKSIELLNYVEKMSNIYGYLPNELGNIRDNVYKQVLILLKNKYGEIDYKTIKEAY